MVDKGVWKKKGRKCAELSTIIPSASKCPPGLPDTRGELVNLIAFCPCLTLFEIVEIRGSAVLSAKCRVEPGVGLPMLARGRRELTMWNMPAGPCL